MEVGFSSIKEFDEVRLEHTTISKQSTLLRRTVVRLANDSSYHISAPNDPAIKMMRRAIGARYRTIKRQTL